MSHSPLPWAVHRSGEVVDVHGEFVASIEGEVETPRDDDNANLIVRAVNRHDSLVAALDSCLTQIEQMAGMFDDSDGAIKRSADNARELLSGISQDRGQQPAPIVFQLSQPEQPETLKLLAWCIAQFDGTSGAGLNHWIQSPEYRRACELIGQELPPFDEGDEEAEQPVSNANKLPEIPRDELKCSCGCEEFRYVEEIYNWRKVKSLNDGVLTIDAKYETGEGYDDGHNPVLECRECVKQYAIPEDFDLDFT